jgi:CheY-like chemotaxis protein
MASNDPIVVIEDDLDDHYFIHEVAKKINLKHELKFFTNGADALNYLTTTSDHPFLILCDLNMPHVNGLELRGLINTDDYLREKSIPFVFFSTVADPAAVKNAYLMTVQGFFVKESGLEELEKTIRLIVDYWTKCKHPNSVNHIRILEIE